MCRQLNLAVGRQLHQEKWRQGLPLASTPRRGTQAALRYVVPCRSCSTVRRWPAPCRKRWCMWPKITNGRACVCGSGGWLPAGLDHPNRRQGVSNHAAGIGGITAQPSWTAVGQQNQRTVGWCLQSGSRDALRRLKQAELTPMGQHRWREIKTAAALPGRPPTTERSWIQLLEGPAAVQVTQGLFHARQGAATGIASGIVVAHTQATGSCNSRSNRGKRTSPSARSPTTSRASGLRICSNVASAWSH